MNQVSWIAWRLVSFLIHLLATLIYLYGLTYAEITYPDRVKESSEPAWGRDWKFLTRWNFTIQLAVQVVLLLVDLIMIGKMIVNWRSSCLDVSGHPDKKFSSFIKRISLIIDQIIYSLAFPLGVFVTITFWILDAMGPGTVTNGPIKYIWLNHIMHTAVGPVILLELLITPHKRPSNHIRSMLILLVFTLIFIVWLFFVYIEINFWLYPIIGKLGTAGKIAFISGCALMLLTLYWIGVAINKIFWSEERVSRFKNPPIPLGSLDNTIMTGMSHNYNPE